MGGEGREGRGEGRTGEGRGGEGREGREGEGEGPPRPFGMLPPNVLIQP